MHVEKKRKLEDCSKVIDASSKVIMNTKKHRMINVALVAS